MKICVYGAGAVGGVIGARLALAGREVSLIARGAHLAAMRANGITLRHAGRERGIAVACADDPRALGPQDLVICAAKAHSLTAVARDIAPLLRPDTPVVFAINGVPWWYFHRCGGAWDGTRLETVDPGGAIWERIGPERAIGCVVYMAADVPAPGVVSHNTGGRLILGEPDGSESDRLAAIAAALGVEGLAPEVSRRIRDDVFVKLLSNLSINIVAVLTRLAADRIIAEPRLRALVKAMMAECVTVGTAIGADLDIDLEARVKAVERIGAFRPSTLQDLEAGRKLEIEALIGVVAELGRIAGVPTPTIDVVYALARALAENLGLYPKQDALNDDR